MEDKEKVLASIRIAESLVRRELTLEKMETLDAPAPVIEDQKALVAEALEAVKRDILAGELISQARQIVRLRRDRQLAIEQRTVLGRLAKAIEKAHPGMEAWRAGKKPADFQPFSGPNGEMDNREWKRFIRSLENWEIGTALQALRNLLNSAVIDLTFPEMELPPLPPPYIVEEKEYKLRDLN